VEWFTERKDLGGKRGWDIWTFLLPVGRVSRPVVYWLRRAWRPVLQVSFECVLQAQAREMRF
jgi:hypothetical protein